MVVGDFTIKAARETCMYQVYKDGKQFEGIPDLFTSHNTARTGIENYLHNYKQVEPVAKRTKKEVTEGGEATS